MMNTQSHGQGIQANNNVGKKKNDIPTILCFNRSAPPFRGGEKKKNPEKVLRTSFVAPASKKKWKCNPSNNPMDGSS